MRRFLILLGLLSTLGVIYGFMGTLHRSADSIAMLSPLFGLFMVIGAYATRLPWLRVWMGLAGVLVMGAVLLFVQAQEPGGDLRLYSKNLKFLNEDTGPISADILAAQVDLVMLQELSDQNKTILSALASDFPHQHVCDFGPLYTMAVLSRTPFADGGLCSAERGAAAAPVTIGGQRLWAVSIHVPWPWPAENGANETAITELLTVLDGPFVLAGDFNILPWSGRLRRIRMLTETRLAGPSQITFARGLLRLPIDHVLSPSGGAVQRRPLLGSDHHGLVADVGL